MIKYFMNDEVYFQGKKLPQQKTILPIVEDREDGTAFCYDESGNSYILKWSEILEDTKEE